MSATGITTPHTPRDVVLERVNDPAVAASLLTLLDNAELLATLVRGLSDLLQRGDTIMDSVATGVTELRAAGRADRTAAPAPTPAELAALAAALTRSTPVITAVLDSSMVSDDTVALLSLVSESASEGAARARQDGTRVSGLRGALRALRDPDVGRGLGLMVEIARALGRRTGRPAS